MLSELTTSPTVANFGVRTICLLFANKTVSETEYYCFRNRAFVIPQALSTKCPCAQATYPDPADPAQCLACDISCWDCFGPSPSQCYRCGDGYSYVSGECVKCHTSCAQCSGPNLNQCASCKTAGDWLYWDNTCKAPCTSPVTSQLVYDALRICNLPCPEGQYMLSHSTCVDSCDNPLNIVTNDTGVFCDKPCDADKYFLMEDGSCIDICDGYYKESVLLDVDICIWKCDFDEYMRWDLTCMDSCDDPLKRVENSTGVFCNKPCPDGEFYYANKSCKDSCVYHFEQDVVLGVVDTCLFKCNSDEFLYENNETCVKICNFPFLQSDGEGSEGKHCYSPCNSAEFILADRSCSANCSSPDYYTEKIDDSVKVCKKSEEYDNDMIRAIAKVIQAEGQVSYGLIMALSLWKMGGSSSLCLASLAKMLEYIKYMRIDYSQKLKLMFQLQGSSELSLSFEVPLAEGIQEKFPDHELPWNFEEYDLGSSYFLNYWETLGTLLVVFAGILVLLLLTKISKGKVYHNLFLWLKTVFKWNFLLMIFCSNFDGVVFFTSLEMRILNVDSFAAFLSVFVCIVVNIFVLLVLGRIIFILKDIRRLKYQQVRDISDRRPIIHAYKKWKSYQVLFLHCNEEKPTQQAFFIIFLVRIYFFHLTIGYIFPDPLVQSVLITLLSVFMLAYLIRQRPLEEKWDFIKMIVNELIVLTVNLCVLVLAALNHNGKQTAENTETLSEIIIMANLVFNTLVMVFLVGEVAVAVFKIYKEIKAHKLKGMNSLLEIFMMIFAGEAMAMEDEYLSPDEKESEKTSVKQKLKLKLKLRQKQKQERKSIELEIPQINDEKSAISATSELLKVQSPKSPRSLVDEGKLSGIDRFNLLRHNKRVSESAFKFDVTSSFKELEGKTKPSTILRHENGSRVFLSPSFAKIDTANEKEKLLFEN